MGRRVPMACAALLALAGAGCDRSGGPPAKPQDAEASEAAPSMMAERPDGGADCEVWELSGLPSSVMLPGYPCLDCHRRTTGSAKPMTVAGTVFGRLDARDGCRGVPDVTVTVIDAEGKEFSLRSNPAGNFYTARDVTFPIAARLEAEGRIRRMEGRVAHGNCNACHTPQGDEMAPGRILTPAAP